MYNTYKYSLLMKYENNALSILLTLSCFKQITLRIMNLKFLSSVNANTSPNSEPHIQLSEVGSELSSVGFGLTSELCRSS